MPGLAIDISTKCGFAHTDGTSGLFRLPGGENGARWVAFKDWLDAFLAKHATTWLVTEGSLHQPGAAARVANAIYTQVEIACWEHELDHKNYQASTIKKHATNNGRADKVAMWEAAKARGITFLPETDDVVDACWLLDLANQDFA